jgi:hypothetical protein
MVGLLCFRGDPTPGISPSQRSLHAEATGRYMRMQLDRRGSSPIALGPVAIRVEPSELLEAMQTRLIKRPDSKLLLISAAAAQLDSPLGRLRARALAQPTAKRTDAVVEARGDLHWLEWSVPDDDLDDLDAVKRANPAPWIDVPGSRRQRAAVLETAFAQFHACRWRIGERSWLPPGAWQACVGEPDIVDGEDVWIGVDIGGERSATAVVCAGAQCRLSVVTPLPRATSNCATRTAAVFCASCRRTARASTASRRRSTSATRSGRGRPMATMTTIRGPTLGDAVEKWLEAFRQ